MKKKTIWITSAAVGAVLVLGGAGVAVAVELADDDRLSGTALEKASTAALDAVGSGTVTDAEASDDLDHAYEVEVTLDNGREVEVLLDESFAVARSDANTGHASATDDDGGSLTGSSSTDSSDDSSDDSADSTSSDDSTAPLTEADRSAASAAALAAMAPGSTGTITQVERSDDLDHAYEVEVTLPSGGDIDVELDESFTVLTVEGVPVA